MALVYGRALFGVAIRGMGSAISRAFIDRINEDYGNEKIIDMKRGDKPQFDVERYLICQGILHGKSRIQQTDQEIHDTYFVNYVQVARLCDDILENNPNARICVIGSESGISGSYDEIYADSKRLLHYYVETKSIGIDQQLVCVAPSIIDDSGMTLRRNDKDNLAAFKKNHSKGRFLSCAEVAEMIYFLLYIDKGYTTGVVIRMNGGNHTL